jgi:hypothetical protein
MFLAHIRDCFFYVLVHFVFLDDPLEIIIKVIIGLVFPGFRDYRGNKSYLSFFSSAAGATGTGGVLGAGFS